MNEAAIADAHINAEINGIKNCKFVCGKVLIWGFYMHFMDITHRFKLRKIVTNDKRH